MAAKEAAVLVGVCHADGLSAMETAASLEAQLMEVTGLRRSGPFEVRQYRGQDAREALRLMYKDHDDVAEKANVPRKAARLEKLGDRGMLIVVSCEVAPETKPAKVGVAVEVSDG